MYYYALALHGGRADSLVRYELCTLFVYVLSPGGEQTSTGTLRAKLVRLSERIEGERESGLM